MEKNNRLKRKRTPLVFIVAFLLGLAIIAVFSVVLAIYDLLVRPIKNNYMQMFRAWIRMMPPHVREHFRIFDDYGLRYHVKHLNALSWRDMTAWDIPDLAEYADINTVTAVKQNSRGHTPFGFYRVQEEGTIDWKKEIEYVYNENIINATMVGNIAYYCLHEKDDTIRQIAFNQLCWLREKCGHPPMEI